MRFGVKSVKETRCMKFNWLDQIVMLWQTSVLMKIKWQNSVIEISQTFHSAQTRTCVSPREIVQYINVYSRISLYSPLTVCTWLSVDYDYTVYRFLLPAETVALINSALHRQDCLFVSSDFWLQEDLWYNMENFILSWYHIAHKQKRIRL
jgi:hypothetical protein